MIIEAYKKDVNSRVPGHKCILKADRNQEVPNLKQGQKSVGLVIPMGADKLVFLRHQLRRRLKKTMPMSRSIHKCCTLVTVIYVELVKEDFNWTSHRVENHPGYNES